MVETRAGEPAETRPAKFAAVPREFLIPRRTGHILSSRASLFPVLRRDGGLPRFSGVFRKSRLHVCLYASMSKHRDVLDGAREIFRKESNSAREVISDQMRFFFPPPPPPPPPAAFRTEEHIRKPNEQFGEIMRFAHRMVLLTELSSIRKTERERERERERESPPDIH